jgi:hypothetical protein
MQGGPFSISAYASSESTLEKGDSSGAAIAQIIGIRFQVSGVRETELQDPDTSYESSSVLNTEKIERRTSNAQHRTFNIDSATLYLL